MGNRHTTELTTEGHRISIASKKNWSMLLILPLWLAGWTFGGFMALKVILHPKPETPVLFFCIWMVGWAAGEAWALYMFLWTAFGKEVVTAGDGNLVLRKDILGYGRSRVFPISQVQNLRASGLFGSLQGWSGMMRLYGFSGGVIAFDVQNATQRFGIQLDENEAQEIIEELRSHLG
jgi:hypothetical protein